MADAAIIAISSRGSVLARRLAMALRRDHHLYVERRFGSPGDAEIQFDLPLRPLVRRLFAEYRALVLFMPVGAAVRLLAPHISDKHSDPAVVCVDDAGRFAISLLSGHEGGADSLAEEVAEILGGTPVITSASYVTGTLAVDLLGKEFGWTVEAARNTVTRASAAVVNGEAAGVLQEAGETHWWPHVRPLPDNIRMHGTLDSLAAAHSSVALVISDRLMDWCQSLKATTVVIYRPRTLAVGMGCRRGVPAEELERLLRDTFCAHALALNSILCIATAELKKDEPGINRLADKLGVPVHCYGAEELNSLFGPYEQSEQGRSPEAVQASLSQEDETKPRKTPTASPTAHRLLGLWGLSEPAALLASGTKELLVTRRNTDRATIAIARKEFQNIQRSDGSS